MASDQSASSPCQAPPGYWDPGKRLILFVGSEKAILAATQFNLIAHRMGMNWLASSDVNSGAIPDRIVAFGGAQNEALLRKTNPDLQVFTENWSITNAESTEREVIGLVTRLLGGRTDAPEIEAKPEPHKKVLTAKVGRETSGRRGKGVTTIFDLPMSDAELADLAAKLKQRCGTGGTVKNRRIEIQGDNRERVIAELEKMGFKVKRAGG